MAAPTTAKEEVLLLVQQDGLALEQAPADLRNDREVVIAATKQNGFALQFASEDLRDDATVVRTAVGQNPLALQYAGEATRSSDRIVFQAVSRNGMALQYACERLRCHRKIVFPAVRRHELALEFAAESLRNDKDLVLTAVRMQGLALQFASEDLRSDREVVAAAVSLDGSGLPWACAKLQEDVGILALALVSTWLWDPTPVIRHISPVLLGDRAFILSVIRHPAAPADPPHRLPRFFWCLPAELQQDSEIMLSMLARSHGSMPQSFPPPVLKPLDALICDRDWMLHHVSKDGLTLRAASPALRADREVVLAAIAQNPCAFECAAEYFPDDSEVQLVFLRGDSEEMAKMAPRLGSHPDVVLEAAQKGLKVLNYLVPPLASDKDFVLKLVRLGGQQLAWSKAFAADQELGKAASSRIALRGEPEAPVANVEVRQHPDDKHRVSCNVTFELSGRIEEISLDSEAVLGNLAMELVIKRPKTVKAYRRVALLIKKPTTPRSSGSSDGQQDQGHDGNSDDDDDDDEPLVMTPHDWNRPLKDFAYIGQQA